MLALAFPAAAQVSVELALNQYNYMQYEPVYARIRIRNFSGQPLVFGKNEKLKGDLLLHITHRGRLVKPIGQKEFSLVGTVLMPGQTQEFIFPIDRYYCMNFVGEYRVYAYVRHQMMKDTFRSHECVLEITKGVEIWRRTVGIPKVLTGRRKLSEMPQEIDSRAFVLRVMTERASRYYYLLVEDPKRIYAVIRVGREIAMVPYSLNVDMLNRLHLIVPAAPRLFRYMVVNLDGKVEQQEMYMQENKVVPRLVRNKDTGEVTRVGGVAAMPGVDYAVPGAAKKTQAKP